MDDQLSTRGKVSQDEARWVVQLIKQGKQEGWCEEYIQERMAKERKRKGNCLFIFARVCKPWRKAQLQVGPSVNSFKEGPKQKRGQTQAGRGTPGGVGAHQGVLRVPQNPPSSPAANPSHHETKARWRERGREAGKKKSSGWGMEMEKGGYRTG